MQFHNASCLLRVLSAQVEVDPTYAEHFDEMERAMRAAATGRRTRRCVKEVARTADAEILLTWVKECSYNNAWAWVTTALRQNRINIKPKLWPVAAPSSTASGSHDAPGAPPVAPALGDSPAGPARNPKRKAAGCRRGRQGAKRLKLWGSGWLRLRPRPQQPQSQAVESDHSDIAEEGAPPGGCLDDESSPPSPRWLLQKILAKSNGLSKKPRGLGMQSLPDQLASGSLLGEGSFAHTYRYRQHTLGDIALKVFKNRSDVEDFMSEVDFMTKFDHPNIVKCLDVVVCKKLGIIMPYGGECLHHRVKACDYHARVRWHSKVALTSQLMAAVAYMHGHDVIHTDLKPANTVVDAEGHLVVIDLGACVVDRPDHRHLWLPRFDQPEIPCGTIWYRAPETLLGWTHIRKGVDVWAAGCTIWEIWVGSTLFKAWTRPTMLKKILAQLGLPKGDALSWVRTLPNWRRELSAYGTQKREMSWKQRLALACPSKAHGHWLDQLLQLMPSDRASAGSARASLARLPEVEVQL